MGPAQDHAILLCSVLLGCGKDAYVCKGTVWVEEDSMQIEGQGADAAEQPGAAKKKKKWRLIEHAWVMTREADSYVSFWETCTREIYHLPHRWTESKKKKKAKKKEAEQGEEEEEEETALAKPEEQEWNNEVPDVSIHTAEEYDQLPTIGRMPRPKQKAVGDRTQKGKGARDKLQERLAK
jgi:centrosomal protein CEP76